MGSNSVLTMFNQIQEIKVKQKSIFREAINQLRLD